MNNKTIHAGLGCVFAILVSWPLYGQLVSAEIGYQKTAEGLIQVTLTTYLECSEQEPTPAQGVSFFEGFAGMPKTDVELPLVSSKKTEAAFPISCGHPEDNCYIKAVYSTTVELTPREDGYNLVWQQRSWEGGSFTNLDPVDNGVSLIVKIPGATENGHVMPQFLSAPPFIQCAAKEAMQSSLSVDMGAAETYKLGFFAPLTTTSEQELLTSIDNMTHDTDPTFLFDPKYPYPQAVPPYLPVKYMDGYSAEEPLGTGNVRYDEKLQTIGFVSPYGGRYLLGEKIETFKNKKKISESQRVTVVTFYN